MATKGLGLGIDVKLRVIPKTRVMEKVTWGLGRYHMYSRLLGHIPGTFRTFCTIRYAE